MHAASMAALNTIISAMLAACAGSSVTGDEVVPGDAARETGTTVCATKRFYTASDDGCRVSLALGQSAELLARDLHAPEPQVEGDAIELIGIANVGASDRRTWEIRARAPGTSRIVVPGRQPFTLTIEVPPE